MRHSLLVSLLLAGTNALTLGPTCAPRVRIGRIMCSEATAELEQLPKTLDEALALEGDELEAAANALRIYLFKSPPFQEKIEQPKRQMLAYVYEKLGDLGKAESCAREACAPCLRS